MTIQGNDPEISFRPTAPPPPIATAPRAADNVPVASATAIPIVSATAVPADPTNSGNLTSSLLPNGYSIERTAISDGSLSVKVTKTTTQSDGFRSVRIEHYVIPANMASTAIQTMDFTGEAPSSLYLTKIEDHRLPPYRNVGEALHRPPGPGIPTGSAGGGGAAATTTTVTDNEDERTRRNRMACCSILCMIVLFWVIGTIFRSASTKSEAYAPSPSYSYPTPSYSYPSPSFPTYPTYQFNDDWITRITLPPILNAPPTKSPAPSNTPYPTWDPDHNSFSWLLTPTPNNVHMRAVMDTPVVMDERENGGDVKVTPVIISPTFSKKPTTAPTPASAPRSSPADNFTKQN